MAYINVCLYFSAQTCRVILNIRETADKEMVTILPRAADGSRGLTLPALSQYQETTAGGGATMPAPKITITAAFKFNSYLSSRSAVGTERV